MHLNISSLLDAISDKGFATIGVNVQHVVYSEIKCKPACTLEVGHEASLEYCRSILVMGGMVNKPRPQVIIYTGKLVRV